MLSKAKMIEQLNAVNESVKQASQQVPTWTGDDDDLETYRDLLRVRDLTAEAVSLLAKHK